MTRKDKTGDANVRRASGGDTQADEFRSDDVHDGLERRRSTRTRPVVWGGARRRRADLRRRNGGRCERQPVELFGIARVERGPSGGSEWTRFALSRRSCERANRTIERAVFGIGNRGGDDHRDGHIPAIERAGEREHLRLLVTGHGSASGDRGSGRRHAEGDG